MNAKKTRKKNDKFRSAGAFLLCLCLLLNCFLTSGVFAAVEQKETYQVTFHDMDVNGEEFFSSKKAVSTKIGEGETLNEGLAGKKLRIGDDKREVLDLVWYTLDEDGDKELFDPETPVEEDLDLYTYTYGIRLIEGTEYADFWSGLDPEVVAYVNKYSAGADRKTASNANADGKIKRIIAKFRATPSDASKKNAGLPDMTDVEDLMDDDQRAMLADALDASRFICAREGDPITAFSETEEENTGWTDLETGETVDLENVAEEGLSENLTLVAAANGATVYCYVIVDGKEQLIKETEISTTSWIAYKNRYYISIDELEEIYGGFGFSADDYKEEHCFPHGDNSDDWETGKNMLWADQTPQKINGKMCIPLSYRNPIYLFYMPDILSGTEKYITQSGSLKGSFPRKADSPAYLANTFYSLTVADPEGIVYENPADVPEIKYGYHGTQAEITVPEIDPADGKWVLMDGDGKESDVGVTRSEQDGQLVYTFSNLSQSYALTAVPASGKVPVDVECYAIVNGSPQKVKTIRTAYGPYKAESWDYARYYLTAETLEEVYGAFGFLAENYKGELVFPHTDDDSAGSKKLWANISPVFETGEEGTEEWKIPLSKETKTYLFYLPNGQSYYDDDNTCVNPLKNLASPAVTNDNFYTVAVKDADHIAYTNDALIPDVRYVSSGQDAELSVKKIADTSVGHWEIYDADTNAELDAELVGDKNGLVTYKLSSVSCPVRFETVKENLRASMKLECYAVVDGQMTLIQTLTRGWGPVKEKESKWNWDGGGYGKYYITASELEKVYGSFGFKASDFDSVSLKDWYGYASKNRIFPNTDSRSGAVSQAEIWADALMTKHGSEVRIPLCQGDNLGSRLPLRVYYLPYNTEGNTGYFSQKQSVTDQTMLLNNTFYALTVSDPQGDVYGKKSDIPSAQYTRENGTLSVTVPLKKNVTWKAFKSDGTEITDTSVVSVQDNQDGTCTYTAVFEKKDGEMPYSVTLRPVSTTPSVIYNAGVESGKIQLGELSTEKQITLQDESIHGFTQYADPFPDGENAKYTILGTDTGYAVVQESAQKGRRLFYTFAGWTVEGTNPEVVLQPGDVLDHEVLSGYKNSADGNVYLRAKWKTRDDTNKRIESVNFYVNLKCEIMDNTSNGFDQSSENDSGQYSSSVYSTVLNGGETLPGGTDMHVVLPPEAGENAYETDRILRRSAKNPITEYHNKNGKTESKDGECELTLASFPSDEDVLEQLRLSNADIQMDGVKIANEYLTTDHFAVRWYVLKYLNTDGWHIDGVLVAKKGRFVVKKTFAGDNRAIARIKGNYQISVTHKDSGADSSTEDYELVLKPKEDAGLKAGETGYTKYDETTNTYIWIMDARQGREYQIEEKNYTLDDSDWSTACYYMIRNSSSDTGGWRNYDSSVGVSLTAESYANDIPEDAIQTAEFRNVYIQAGLLTIHKIDNATKNGLSGVKFQISRVEETEVPLTIYRKPGTHQYSADERDHGANGYTKSVEDNLIQTDVNGSIYIKLPEGTYDLKEEFPIGYDGAELIRIRVTEGGALRYVSSVTGTGSSAPSGGWIESVSDSEITIRNRSKLLMTVTAKKNWENTPESGRRRVVVELWCDGMKLPESTYKQELSAENDWTYEWNRLPLFIDGELANYSLKETMIGDTAYDADADESDGYKDYMVTYDNPLYRKGTDGTYSELGAWRDENGEYQYSDQALLTVNNRPDKGVISFIKLNRRKQNLPGAEFTLYSDPACTVEVAKAVSSNAGFVTFDNQVVGTYYMKETSVPVGYQENPKTYRVVLGGGRSTITEIESGQELTEIQNTSKMILILKKVDAEDETLALGGSEFKISLQNGPGGICKVNKNGTPVTGINENEGLPEGDYLFQEIKAPRGYETRKEILRVRLKGGKFFFVLNENDENTDITEYGKWKLTKETDDTWTLTVKDDRLYSLPSVGGPGMYVVFVFGTGLMCLAAAILILPAGRRKLKET